MFVFMYVCFEGGGHKKPNPAQNKALGDPASPIDVFHGENHRDKRSSSLWQCVSAVCVCVQLDISEGMGGLSSQKPQDVFCQNSLTPPLLRMEGLLREKVSMLQYFHLCGCRDLWFMSFCRRITLITKTCVCCICCMPPPIIDYLGNHLLT